ncbi:hypothetical protein PpBr36_04671 [Pyricularia pennisetigena]|uniref:hypothetical protein n=1 Tax=Pyricularia pennisetigena TaxID=1578925 RepID=UPI0011515509|nr:hypothetical protein PpBr36_04671 [Pyricularia pennisetigena]TLS26952.1 hypothetical protein PpBr36_04671 [Pyricularia pennisetigena]
MAEKLDEDQVSSLIAILRKDVSVDAKVQQVNAVKSSIKQHNVPDNCVVPVFEALRIASTAQHAVLVNAGFTGLNHLITRMSRQEPKYLTKEAVRLLPLLVEKLGDQKEKFRTVATQSLITMYKATPAEVERVIRNVAMVGKNPRAKEASLHWLLQMHQEHGLQFRAYVPTLMDLLEDADAAVRDAAKTTVIELFRNAPNAAKSDLKKQLKNFKVRPAIEQAIVKELVPASLSAAPSDVDARPASRAESTRSTRANLSASTTSAGIERPVTPGLLDSKPETVDPTYVNTQRELDDIIKEMHLYFEGKETEQNWLQREESIKKLRRLLAGNAVSDFHDAFLGGVRGLLDGIIKAVTSLRTSLSKEGCSLIQELALAYGPGIDPMVEILMQTFIKLCAATKKISSQLANVTVDTIISKVTYNTRIAQHIWFACQDKNVQPRTYATGWLKTLLSKEAQHKSHIEHHGGLELVEKCIKKGLADSNPLVREKMRVTYWTFNEIWPARAEAIMEDLDATAKKLLQKSSGNTSSPKPAAGGARPGMGLSRSTMTASKPSLREAMLAQKRALASKNLPARPGSAMAHFSPVRTASSASSATTTSTTAAKPPVRQKQQPEAHNSNGSNSLSVAPVRPGRKRPELAARPATAGPYSVRTHDTASLEQNSPPEKTRSNAVTPKTFAASPKRTAPRTRPGHMSSASEPNVPSPSRPKSAASKAVAPSPRASPAKPKPTSVARTLRESSPSKPVEAPSPARTLASPMPASPAPAVHPVPAGPIQEPETEQQETRPESRTSTPPDTPQRPVKVYEDPFTVDEPSPKPMLTRPVLEDIPINEDAANLVRPVEPDSGVTSTDGGPLDKTKQYARLLDSGISKIRAHNLDVHGFRKLQTVVRDNKFSFTDDKFEALLLGLFDFLQSPLSEIPTEKVPDVKAQILATIKLLLKRARDNFQPHVSHALESLLEARGVYEARTHIVSGMELLADELVTVGDPSEMVVVLTQALQGVEMDARGCRSLTMGLHVLREVVDARPDFHPTESELAALSGLAARCLDSHESGVRMDAVQLCVALHARVGDTRFWDTIKGVKEDPKSLITYYIVKRQREHDAAASNGLSAAVTATVI